MKKIVSIMLVCALCAVLCACGEVRSKFEDAKDIMLQYAGQISHGDNYFSADTNPYNETKMSPTAIKILEDDTRENTLKGIQYTNIELGFPASVYSDMIETTAKMGLRTAETENYRVSWTYHPDEGLEVKYEIK